MEIQKLFAELGRMHLEILQLKEQLIAEQGKSAQLEKQLAEVKPADTTKPE
jgi:hypothetical protein